MPLPTHRVLIAAALLCAALPPLSAQQPARRWERAGFDFTATGVWRARARRVRAERAALRSRGDFAALNAGAQAARFGAAGAVPFASQATVAGTLRIPMVMVRFTNSPNVGSLPLSGDVEDAMFGINPPFGRPYTLRTFYEEMSGGLLSVQGQVIGWVDAPNIDAYYEGPNTAGNPCNGLCGLAKTGELLREAFQTADPQTDYGLFDNDGPDGLPNSGDDDGFVDVAALLHPEVGGECGPATGNLWAHRFAISGWGAGPYVSADSMRDGGGNAIPGSFVRVNDYILQSAFGGATSCDGNTILPVGTVAHEFGHGLGLPDLYDTNPFDEDDSEGLGSWGLMSSGNYTLPYSPSSMEGWSRAELGWVTVRQVSASTLLDLGPYTLGDTIIYVAPTGTNPRGEYFLLENRQGTLSDSALIRLRGPGLLIYHIDSLKICCESGFNGINSGAIHGVNLIQADGLNNLGSSVAGVSNRGDAGDPWPGTSGRTVFGLQTTPRLTLHSGNLAGLVVDSIRQLVPGGAMRLRLRFGSPTLFQASSALAAIRVRGVPYGFYAEIYSDGDTVTISADSVQTTGDGLRRFTFTSWSDAGARTHTVVASAAGATITAGFTQAFRVRVLGPATGGTITAQFLPADSFQVAGDSVLLTAVPAMGLTFLRWTGDTTAYTPVLTLRATRPWAVRAEYASVVAAVDQLLLGGAHLTPSEIFQLDSGGNHNGRFDIGDLVAWLDRTGTVLSAPFATRLFGGNR